MEYDGLVSSETVIIESLGTVRIEIGRMRNARKD